MRWFTKGNTIWRNRVVKGCTCSVGFNRANVYVYITAGEGNLRTLSGLPPLGRAMLDQTMCRDPAWSLWPDARAIAWVDTMIADYRGP